MKRNRVSLRVTSLIHNRSNLTFCFLLLTFYFPILLSASTSHSTVDVRVLEIFHPQEIRVITNSDTFILQSKNNCLYINEKEETMFFSKGESIIEIQGKIKRTYQGTLKVYPGLEEIIIINRVKIDNYLASVVGAEMGKAPIEAQKAQAIVSRTYLFKNLKRHKNYDFCDLTHCQVYKGKESETEKSRRVVRETAGIMLWKGKELADVFYHSTCGGRTADFSSIFEGNNELLISVPDTNFCKNSPHYRWEWRLSFEDAPFKEIKILRRASDGRVTEIEVDGKKERGWEFRMRIARQFGWNKLRSSLFTVEKKVTYFHFKGKGFGHGLGMCQWGAKGMAEQGKTAEEILKHYFPKLQLRIGN